MPLFAYILTKILDMRLKSDFCHNSHIDRRILIFAFNPAYRHCVISVLDIATYQVLRDNAPYRILESFLKKDDLLNH